MTTALTFGRYVGTRRCCREWWLPRHLTSRWSEPQRSPGLWCRSFCVLHTTPAWVGDVSSTKRSGQWDHFFLASAAVFLFALFRPSYFGTLAGTDRFLLFRLPMLPASFCLFSHWPNDLGVLGVPGTWQPAEQQLSRPRLRR